MSGERLNENKMVKILDVCYDKALDGIPLVSESVEELGNEYINKYGRTDLAISKLVNTQIAKCGTSGFLTGLGGMITLPISVPANISSVIYVQLRMIATIAYIRGFNPKDDEVRTCAYVCLTGKAMSDVLKETGIKTANKLALNMVKKIPGATLTKINQKVGFRLVTKFGEKGVINLGKAIPLVGGFIGGGFDVATTKTISNNAKNMFNI